MNEANEKNCVYCQSIIPARASYCKECRRSQNQLYDFLWALGSIAGGLGLLGVGLTYLFSELPPIARQSFSHTAEIVSASGDASGVVINVFNSGIAPLLVAGSTLYIPNRKHARISIGARSSEKILPGDVASVLSEGERSGLITFPYVSDIASDWKLSQEQVEELLADRDCFDVAWQLPSGGAFAQQVASVEREGSGQRLLRFSATLALQYFKAGEQVRRSFEVPVVAVIVQTGTSDICGETAAAALPAMSLQLRP